MLSLINILIVVFIILILFQTVLANRIIEGVENNTQYKDYDTSDSSNAMVLAQQNAGNIGYIKQRLETTQDLVTKVRDNTDKIESLQDQVNALVAAQKQYADQMTGGTPPDVSGTE